MWCYAYIGYHRMAITHTNTHTHTKIHYFKNNCLAVSTRLHVLINMALEHLLVHFFSWLQPVFCWFPDYLVVSWTSTKTWPCLVMMTATGNIREPQVHYHGIMVRLKFCKDPLWFEITANKLIVCLGTIWDGFGMVLGCPLGFQQCGLHHTPRMFHRSWGCPLLFGRNSTAGASKHTLMEYGNRKALCLINAFNWWDNHLGTTGWTCCLIVHCHVRLL